MPADPARVKSLFLAAADLPETERGGFLDRECGADADLRGRVEALLRADAPAPGGATATFGSVLTNTRNGSSARDVSADDAMAMPRATPAMPASAKPPRISSEVTHTCVCHGTAPPTAARSTAAGPGSRYSRTPRAGPATCQAPSSIAKTMSDGTSRVSVRAAIERSS